MSSSSPPPGPDADAAFTLGLAASTVLAALGIALSAHSGSVTSLGAIVLAIVGLPAVFVVTSCLLAVWLGYDRDAVDAHRLTESIHEHTEERS